MTFDALIIGGTGVGSRLNELEGKPVAVPTSDGLVRGKAIQFGGKSVFALARHSAGHKTPPHLVNYAGFARCAKALGVKAVLASAAVGCLVAEWVPGTLVLCDDFLDDSGRHLTLFNRDVVHRDFTHPFDPALRSTMLSVAAGLGLEIQPRGVYLTGNGPRYETPAEIEMYRRWGAQLVGMTASSEATLMREAEVPYACLAVVTNLAAGMVADATLNHEEVVEMMQRRGTDVLKIFENTIAAL